jgi:type I restriction enzyme S subunit
VDKKIDFIEKKRDLWKTYKKGIIYQIFNQKLRFKDENGQNFPNWNEKSLFSIADIYGGGTPSTEKSDYWNGSINWFTPSEVGKDKYVDSSNRKISENGLKNSSAKLLPPGTILISSRATIGQMSILKSEGSTNQGFQSLIVNENHSNEFIYYLCHILKRELIHRASGSTFLEISKNEVGNIKIKVPTLSEQIIIANFLSSIDVKIEKIVKELEIIREFKKGLLQQIFC